MLALAANADPRAFTRAAEGRALVGGRIMRLVVAAMLGREPSAVPLHLQLAAWAPDRKDAGDLLRRALVLLADHELNASTFTVRCAASTGLNLYDAMIAGLVALKGPRHGGAGVLASQLVRTLGRATSQRSCAIAWRSARRFRVWPRRLSRAIRARLRCSTGWRGPAPTGDSPGEIPEGIAEAAGVSANIDYALAVLMQRSACPRSMRWCCSRWRAPPAGSRMPASSCSMAG